MVTCLHIYPIMILLLSQQSISALQNTRECLCYIYVVCKTEHSTDGKTNSPLGHALAGTRHEEPFCTRTKPAFLLSKTTNTQREKQKLKPGFSSVGSDAPPEYH